LVGSSSSITSGSQTSASVIASRLRQPPLSAGRLRVEVRETGAATQLTQPPLALGFVHMRGGQRGFQNLPDAEAGGKARVLRHVGGAGALAHRQFA
jgi:hypothetical protein